MSLLSTLTAVPALTVLFDRQDTNVFFLYPTAPDELPVGDTRVQGNVVLILPSERNVSRITLELIGQQSFHYKGRQRTVEALRRELVLGEDAVLPQGQHAFAFDFQIPSSIAPSTSSDHGGVIYRLYCRVPKLGRMGTTLAVERKLAFIVNHSNRLDGLPPGHSSQQQISHHRMGPTLLELASPHLLIGGYIRFYITWSCIILPFKIVSLTLEIVQQIRIRPSLDALGPCESHEIRQIIWTLEEEKEWPSVLTGIVYPQEEQIAVSRQARIINGASNKGQPLSMFNASHHPYSRSCIMPSTEIVLTLVYESYEGGATPSPEQLSRPTLQELQVRSSACLSSCWCLLDYHRLPAYSEDSEAPADMADPETALPKGVFGFSMCSCQYAELDEKQERDYGVSRAEVEEQWRAEQGRRAWIEMARHKSDHGTDVSS